MTAGAVLRSAFDPVTATISLELYHSADARPAGTHLALTSIVQLTPGPETGARLTQRLASYHELEPTAAAADGSGTVWTLAGLRTSHAPRHANDGPVSAFLILPDATTAPVQVEPMRRLGEDRPPARPVTEPGARDLPPLVPYPTHVEVSDARPSPLNTASLTAGPIAARDAWGAIADLGRRVRDGSPLADGGGVSVSAAVVARLGDEEYRIVIDGDAVLVEAAGPAGFRHAFVTLAQWLAVGLPSRAGVVDRPRYPFRGLHVDLARQWFEPMVVEWLIDSAAWRKLSRLHLHLTDDEAWRLPVAGFPELADTGAVRGHRLAIPPMLGGGPEPVGRAYTPEEIRRWVTRADSLGVVLVPEVDLPAHVHAALTALPALRDPADTSGAASVQFFTDNVLVPGHPLTRPFVEAVVDAVAELFPSSPWIHIGGDEVPERAWEGSPIAGEFAGQRGLSSRREVAAEFHRDLVTMIGERTGRRVAAWQEAAESGGVLPVDGYVVGWRTVEASRELAGRGYDVVVSPGQAYYLDMAIDHEWDTPGASWAGAISLADVCDFDPEAGWSDAERAHLLGIQACLWTEHVHDEAMLRQFLLPRLDAIAERAWTGTIVGGAPCLTARTTASAPYER